MQSNVVNKKNKRGKRCKRRCGEGRRRRNQNNNSFRNLSFKDGQSEITDVKPVFVVVGCACCALIVVWAFECQRSCDFVCLGNFRNPLPLSIGHLLLWLFSLFISCILHECSQISMLLGYFLFCKTASLSRFFLESLPYP